MPAAPQPEKDKEESVTVLLSEAGKGSPQAAARLVDKIYAELHRLAKRLMLGERNGHTLQASALVNEAYLKLFGSPPADQPRIQYQSRAHFFAVAAQQMRRILVDHARGRMAHRRGGAQCRVTLTGAVASTDDHSVDILALNDLLDHLAELSPRQARVVELRYFAGLDCKEVAQLLAVDVRTVKRDWQMARSWLRIHLTA